MMTRSWVPLFISVFVLCLGIAAYVVGVQMGSAVSSTEPGGVVVEAATPADQLPQFTEDGKLIRPHGWESWVMVGASIGLSYSEPVDFQEPTSDDSPGMFHNIYMQPWAYDAFRETGEFAEGTMFILAMFAASNESIPAKGGWYEGEGRLAEIHLKRKDLHESGWGFYGYGREAESAEMIAGDASCYTCHAEETTIDHVFVQFYPALRDGVQPAGTH